MPRKSKPGDRQLTDEEHRLWQKVTTSTTPLPARQISRGADFAWVGTSPDRDPAFRPGPVLTSKVALPFSPPPQAPKPSSLPLTGLDRRTEQRLGRGQIEVDDRLDLHGMTQSAAHSALRGFLVSAQAQGSRNVLVITGKGAPDVARFDAQTMWGSGRGVLRRLVPEWLSQAEMRVFVSGFRQAHQRHGGGGALYVRIRRRRELTR